VLKVAHQSYFRSCSTPPASLDPTMGQQLAMVQLAGVDINLLAKIKALLFWSLLSPADLILSFF